MKTLVLVGPPGVGKSTLTRRLREEGLSVADLDDEIFRRTGMQAAEIIRSKGDRVFREEEYRALEVVLETGLDVLAVGGGTYCFEQAQKVINRRATAVYLREAEETLARRILADELENRRAGLGVKRPALYRGEAAGGTEREPDLEATMGYLRTLLAERLPQYEKAHFTVDCAGKEEQEIVREILTLVARRNVECL